MDQQFKQKSPRHHVHLQRQKPFFEEGIMGYYTAITAVGTHKQFQDVVMIQTI